MDSSVLILTRFGLGQKVEAFYKNNIPILQYFLAHSLANQSDKSFVWILYLDIAIPESCLKDLTLSLAEIPFKLYFHDPTSSHSLFPSIDEVLMSLNLHLDEIVSCTRVDHDDALSPDFVRVLRRKIASYRKTDYPVHLFSPIGLYYYLEQSKSLCIYKPNYSIQTLCFLNGSTLDIYAHSHQRLYEVASTSAPLSFVPMWIRSISEQTESQTPLKAMNTWPFILFVSIKFILFVFKKTREVPLPLPRKLLERLFRVFNLNYLNINQHELIQLPAIPTGYSYLPRMQAKSAILNQMRHEASAIKKAQLTKLFYSF